MFLHLFIFLFAFLGLSFFKEVGSPEQRQIARKKYIVFIMFLLAIQSGLRNVAVGNDTLAYYYMYDSVMNSSWGQVLFQALLPNSKDPGYAILTKAISTILPSYRLYLIAIAVFFFTALGRVFYKYLHNNTEVLVGIGLYECLYYGFFSITGHRQTIATAILLFALPLIFKDTHRIRNGLLFFVLLVLASTIHKTAFLFAPMYFLPRLRRNKMVFILAFALFIPMFFVGPTLGNYLDDTEFEQYAHYLQQGDTAGAIVFSVYIVLLATAVFFKRKAINAYSPNNYVFASAIAVAMLLSPLLMLNPNNQRIVQYYSIFGLIILPQICDVYSVAGKKSIHYLVFAVLALYTLLRQEPYAFFWQDMVFGDTGQIVNDGILNQIQ